MFNKIHAYLINYAACMCIKVNLYANVFMQVQFIKIFFTDQFREIHSN